MVKQRNKCENRNNSIAAEQLALKMFVSLVWHTYIYCVGK